MAKKVAKKSVKRKVAKKTAKKRPFEALGRFTHLREYLEYMGANDIELIREHLELIGNELDQVEKEYGEDCDLSKFF